MKNLTPLLLALALSSAFPPHFSFAQTQDDSAVRLGEAAQAFAAGSIQMSTPKDGIINRITGDNQTTGNRMITGQTDALYLKLNNPNDAAVGDLFTVYRRVRRVFHPVTREYLGIVTIRVAIVKVTQVDHDLTTVSVVRSYSDVAPGDPVMRFEVPSPNAGANQASDVTDVTGIIVELQADKTVTLISQADVAYVDRGSRDGLRSGDRMEIYRTGGGLPPRKIGQLKILSTEDRTATARISKATTRIMKGDRFRLAAASPPTTQPAELPSAPETPTPPLKAEPAVAPTLATGAIAPRDNSGQTRINLGGRTNFLRYDSGEAAIKPEGYALLDQLIDYLHKSGDERLIRVEGHADNMEIGPSLRSRYPSNWELSKARASGVVRYLIEKGGIDSVRLSSVGYGDSKPLTTNMSEDGRSKNRRVEVLLYAPSADQGSTKPELPESASTLTEPAGLTAKGGEGSAVPAGAADVTPPSGASSSGQEPSLTPAAEAAGTVTVPDSTASGTNVPDAPSVDGPVPATVPDK